MLRTQTSQQRGSGRANVPDAAVAVLVESHGFEPPVGPSDDAPQNSDGAAPNPDDAPKGDGATQ